MICYQQQSVGTVLFNTLRPQRGIWYGRSEAAYHQTWTMGWEPGSPVLVFLHWLPVSLYVHQVHDVYNGCFISFYFTHWFYPDLCLGTCMIWLPALLILSSLNPLVSSWCFKCALEIHFNDLTWPGLIFAVWWLHLTHLFTHDLVVCHQTKIMKVLKHDFDTGTLLTTAVTT